MQLGGNTEESSYSSSVQPQHSSSTVADVITREIICQELKAAEEADSIRRKGVAGGGGGGGGVLFRRERFSAGSSSTEEQHHSSSSSSSGGGGGGGGGGSAAAAVNAVKEKFTSEWMKLGKALSPSKESKASRESKESKEVQESNAVRSLHQVIIPNDSGCCLKGFFDCLEGFVKILWDSFGILSGFFRDS